MTVTLEKLVQLPNTSQSVVGPVYEIPYVNSLL